MKLIVFYPLSSTLSRTGYSTSLRIGYLLNGFLATAGVQEEQYHLIESMKTFRLPGRLQFLLKNYDMEEKGKKTLRILDKMIKSFNKTKHKSAKMIMDQTLARKYVNEFYDHYMDLMAFQFEGLMGIKAMQELINPNHFYFYHLPGDCASSETQLESTVLEIMQLILPDPQNENPIFFIDCHLESRELIDLEINETDTDLAENQSGCYGTNGFIFPLLSKITKNELLAARLELNEPTMEFRQKIDQWAKICYQSPTTNAGLEFFRENLQDYLPEIENRALECPILKHVSEITREKDQAQIIIGQAPIEMIWTIYRDTKAISEKEYDELMVIKTEQYPKYEGRWPVIFLMSLPDDINIQKIQSSQDQHLRKTILVE